MTLKPETDAAATDESTWQAGSADARRARGKALRKQAPRASHAAWQPSADRRDPIEILIESSIDRIPELVPIRYGRMLASPFTFFRGAAAIMAADLARTPTSGLQVQACGDCHLLNFGAFASPERRLLFDINDFDETLPAPWEWDVKRLAASFVIASRHNGFNAADARDSAVACVASYRHWMQQFAEMRALDVWYQRIDIEELFEQVVDKAARQRFRDRVKKAEARTVIEHDYPQLVVHDGIRPRIRDNPPLIYHAAEERQAEFEQAVREAFGHYRDSLPHERRVLLDRYQPEDIAAKVVGVGSVGTRCGILLLMAGPEDPLFLQVKEARASVLEPYAGKSQFANRGQRVVVGQRVMQAASDMFLGWTVGREGRHFYIRQLRDMKIKPLVEIFDMEPMLLYAAACGRALAGAHARSGDPAAISGYLGTGDGFDQAIADFAEHYADQNERDHAALVIAVRDGRLEAIMER